MFRRALAVAVSAVLLSATAALPAQAATSITSPDTMTPTFRFCDYFPIFPGCRA